MEEIQQEKQKKKGINKNIIWAFLSGLLAILTIRIVIKQSKDISIKELLELVSRSNKILFGLSIIASALFVWFEGVAIRSILKSAGYKRGRMQGLIYSTSDVYFSAITPSATGGQPASAYFMHRDGIPSGVITATLVLNLMMYTVSIIVLGVMSIIVSPMAFLGFGTFSKILIIGGIVALSGLSAVFLLILKKGRTFFGILTRLINFAYDRKWIREKKRKLAKLAKTRSDYEQCSELIAGSKDVLVKAFMWNFLQRGSQLLVPMLLHLSLGGKAIEAPIVFAKQCLITIGYNFIPIPGGMGISDYLMIDGFKELMGEQTAFQIEMLSRGITFYICVSISGIITLIGYLIGRKKK